MPSVPMRNHVLVVAFVLVFGWHSAAAAQIANSTAREVEHHLERARVALAAKQPAAAEQEVRAALALDPRNPEAYTDLGVIAFFQGNCPAASANFRRALAIGPANAQAQALLGVCEIRSGNPAGEALLESSFSVLKDSRLRTDVGLELEEDWYRKGDLERAAALAQRLVKLDPDNVNVLYAAQRVYADLARETLNKLALIAPGSARMEEAIAEQLVNEGDAAGAITHYRRALEIDPQLAGVHFELGEAILEASPHDPNVQAQAEAQFDIAERAQGDNAAIECQRGRIARLQSKLAEALAHYRRALRMSPADSAAALGMGEALLDSQRSAEAVKYLTLAAQSDPLNGGAHYQLAIAYRNLHQTEQAQKEMRLFTEIQQSIARVRTLYRQMSRSAVLDKDAAGASHQ